MSRGFSVWLDVLRVWATIIVVASHAAYPRFTGGDYLFIRELNLGSDAVIVFFVISGFVIAYAAERDKTLARYAFNRSTRLLSVLLPALLLTFALDQMGQRLDPSAYTSHYSALPLHQMLLRGVTMSNEWGAFDRVRLGTNGPLWSLSYEAAYYILFAIAFYLSGARRLVLLAGGAWLFGPRILLLIPAWVMGVWLWRHITNNTANRLPLARARLFAVAGPLMYVTCLIGDLPGLLAAQTAEAFAPADYRILLAFSDEFIWNALIGVFTVVHLLGMASLLQGFTPTTSRARWWAGASFSIYVTHYPILHFIDAAVPHQSLARDGLFMAGSILGGLLFAEIFERRIGGLRTGIASVWQRLAFSGRPRQAHPDHPSGLLR